MGLNLLISNYFWIVLLELISNVSFFKDNWIPFFWSSPLLVELKFSNIVTVIPKWNTIVSIIFFGSLLSLIDYIILHYSC